MNTHVKESTVRVLCEYDKDERCLGVWQSVCFSRGRTQTHAPGPDCQIFSQEEIPPYKDDDVLLRIILVSKGFRRLLLHLRMLDHGTATTNHYSLLSTCLTAYDNCNYVLQQQLLLYIRKRHTLTDTHAQTGTLTHSRTVNRKFDSLEALEQCLVLIT
jgi:hypothetical protein